MNWQRLEELRQIFLSAPQSNGIRDYWKDSELLALYDQSLAERIRWKWIAVWNDLSARGWMSQASFESVTDWGCGTGMATRSLLEFLQANGGPSVQKIMLFDRSAMAVQFARSKILEKFPNLDVIAGRDPTQISGSLFLSSHVGNELDAPAKAHLVRSMKKANEIVMVEPGTKDASQFLLEMRGILRKQFRIVAPCFRQDACPLEGQVGKDWCHQFASVPTEIHHDAFWSEFSRRLKIDINSVPLSFLALSKKDPIILGDDAISVIGSERRLKHRTEVLACRRTGRLTPIDASSLQRIEKSGWSAHERS